MRELLQAGKLLETANLSSTGKIDIEVQLHESGLMKELEQELHPDALVMFDSAARGEDIEQSDIDILAVGDENNLI